MRVKDDTDNVRAELNVVDASFRTECISTKTKLIPEVNGNPEIEIDNVVLGGRENTFVKGFTIGGKTF